MKTTTKTIAIVIAIVIASVTTLALPYINEELLCAVLTATANPIMDATNNMNMASYSAILIVFAVSFAITASATYLAIVGAVKFYQFMGWNEAHAIAKGRRAARRYHGKRSAREWKIEWANKKAEEAFEWSERTKAMYYRAYAKELAKTL